MVAADDESQVGSLRDHDEVFRVWVVREARVWSRLAAGASMLWEGEGYDGN